jgi:hypothetical protein
MEQQALYDLYDQEEENEETRDLNNNGLINKPLVVGKELPLMKCPTDAAAHENQNFVWAVSSYKGMAGVYTRKSDGGWINWTGPYRTGMSEYWHNRGLFHQTGVDGLQPEKFSKVTDGTTKTIVVGEYHPTGDIGDLSSIARWARTARYHNKSIALADPLLRTTDRQRCVEYLVTAPLAACNRQFGSTHAGDGGNWLKLDGSVDFISTTVDGEVYEAMATIAGDDEFGRPRIRPRH